MRLDLLYRMTRDNCTYTSMHAKADNMGSTITVMTSSAGEIFGGYSSIPFDKNTKGRKTDFKSFLYSLTRDEKYPVKNPTKAYQEDDSFIFGFGKDDLKVKSNCKGSTYYFGEDFETKPYVTYSTWSTKTMNWLHKETDSDFQPLEIEVLQVRALY